MARRPVEETALRKGWPIPDKLMAKVIRRVGKIALYSDKPRTVMSAVTALLMADRNNIQRDAQNPPGSQDTNIEIVFDGILPDRVPKIEHADPSAQIEPTTGQDTDVPPAEQADPGGT